MIPVDCPHIELKIHHDHEAATTSQSATSAKVGRAAAVTRLSELSTRSPVTTHQVGHVHEVHDTRVSSISGVPAGLGGSWKRRRKPNSNYAMNRCPIDV
jgi:hypothetical protein